MNAKPTLASSGYTPLDLRSAFCIGYLIWFFPGATRTLLGVIPWQKMIYDGIWIAGMSWAALLALDAVFRRLCERGVTLRWASLISVLVSALPIITIAYTIDFFVTGLWPSLRVPGEPRSLSYALATSLCDSLAESALLAAIALLPAIARAHEERLRDFDLLARDAELLRVRAALEPHFVLNSLNAVAGLVEEDPAQARELIAALGDLFRDASEFNASHRVEDEIAWLKRYVTIHELRHPDLLHASWDISEDSLDCVCPALLLQPLVENAVKHGALRGGGHLKVRAHVEAGQLLLSVEDDGPELGAPREGARGLSIVRRRLELESLVPDALQLVREGSTTVARVRMPARLEAAHG